MDAIHQQAYIEMGKAIKKREEWFNKEIQQMKKKEAKAQKRLEFLEKPKEEEKKDEQKDKVKRGGKNAKGRKLTAKEKAEAEAKAKEEAELKAA